MLAALRAILSGILSIAISAAIVGIVLAIFFFGGAVIVFLLGLVGILILGALVYAGIYTWLTEGDDSNNN